MPDLLSPSGERAAEQSEVGRGAVWLAVALLLCLLALARPIDHDESQYVAAAVLTAHGLLPYRDFAYLQAPLQPVLFAPLAWAAGPLAWPALRLANALLGATALYCTWRAARLVVPPRTAWAATALFATCDIFLFSVGTARNDALPAACLAGALWLAVGAERNGATRMSASATGLLLAVAGAAKVSYALPALAYGGWALAHRQHRPGWIALGTVPVSLFVAWTAALAPDAFLFGVWTFPAHAPADFYAARPWKLSGWAKLLDTLKFLALGPALLAAIMALRRGAGLPGWLALAGLAAALAVTPTWRQYLLPMLPPLFVALAAAWARQRPSATVRTLAVAFALIGLAPTALALASRRPAMIAAWHDAQAIRAALDKAGVPGPVATLSPQFLPAAGRLPDPRFAAGPFWFRTRTLTPPATLPLLGRRDLARAPLPRAVLTGGEDSWTSGDPQLDLALEREAARRGYRRVEVGGTRLRLWVKT